MKKELATLIDRWPGAQGWCAFKSLPVCRTVAARDTSALAFVCFTPECATLVVLAFACFRPLPKREFLSRSSPLPHQTILSKHISCGCPRKAWLPTGPGPGTHGTGRVRPVPTDTLGLFRSCASLSVGSD